MFALKQILITRKKDFEKKVNEKRGGSIYRTLTHD